MSDMSSNQDIVTPNEAVDLSENTLTTREELRREGPQLQAAIIAPSRSPSILRDHHHEPELLLNKAPSLKPSPCATIWGVPENLNVVPKHYQLAAGYCTFFVPNTRPNVISKRVTRCMKKLSVEVNYDGPRATFSGVNLNFVAFEGRLFRAPNKDYSHGVIVEVRRLDGCALEFFRMRCAITQSAQGIEEDLDDSPVIDLLPEAKLEEAEVKSIVNETFPESFNLLESKEEDCQVHGVRGLVHVTDGSKSGKEVARLAGVNLLTLNACELLMFFIAYIDSDRTCQSTKHDDLMKFLSLQLISNIFQHTNESDLSLCEDEEAKMAVIDRLDELVRVLVEVVEKAVEKVPRKLHRCYFAISALNALFDRWPSVNVLKHSRGKKHVFETAKFLAGLSHSLLESQANILVKRL